MLLAFLERLANPTPARSSRWRFTLPDQRSWRRSETPVRLVRGVALRDQPHLCHALCAEADIEGQRRCRDRRRPRRSRSRQQYTETPTQLYAGHPRLGYAGTRVQVVARATLEVAEELMRVLEGVGRAVG